MRYKRNSKISFVMNHFQCRHVRTCCGNYCGYFVFNVRLPNCVSIIGEMQLIRMKVEGVRKGFPTIQCTALIRSPTKHGQAIHVVYVIIYRIIRGCIGVVFLLLLTQLFERDGHLYIRLSGGGIIHEPRLEFRTQK